MGMIGSALGGISGNFMSIATANRRASDTQKKYDNQAALARYNQDVANNQRTAELQNAKAAETQAHIKKGQVHSSNRALREKQLAIMAKSGVTMSGSPLLLQQDQIAEMKLAENDITYSGQIQKRGHELRASYYESVADMHGYQAKLATNIGEHKSAMIMAQKKMTIGKMFWDGANVTSFAQIDNQDQFKQFDMGTMGSTSMSPASGGESKTPESSSRTSKFQFMSKPNYGNQGGAIYSSGSSMRMNA